MGASWNVHILVLGAKAQCFSVHPISSQEIRGAIGNQIPNYLVPLFLAVFSPSCPFLRYQEAGQVLMLCTSPVDPSDVLLALGSPTFDDTSSLKI